MSDNRFSSSGGIPQFDANEQHGAGGDAHAHDPQLKIGELLIRSNLVSQENLEDSMKLANKMRMPLGRVLAMHGYLSEDMMNVVVEVQSRMRDGLMPMEAGLKVISLVHLQGLPLESALAKVSAIPSVGGRSNRLGEILRSAGIATPAQIEAGIAQGIDAGLPLGRVLVSKGVMGAPILNAALTAQRLIRDGRISRDQAMHALRGSRLRNIPLQEVLRDNKIDVPDPPIDAGELLLHAGLISDMEISTVREVELMEDKDFDEVLQQMGLIPDEALFATNELVNMVKEGGLYSEQAIIILRKLKDVDWDINQIDDILDTSEEIAEDTIELTELIKASALLDEEDLSKVVAGALAKRQPLSKALVEGGFISQKTLEGAMVCQSFLDRRAIDIEQVRIALSYCHENDSSIAETLKMFEWIPPAVSQ